MGCIDRRRAVGLSAGETLGRGSVWDAGRPGEGRLACGGDSGGDVFLQEVAAGREGDDEGAVAHGVRRWIGGGGGVRVVCVAVLRGDVSGDDGGVCGAFQDGGVGGGGLGGCVEPWDVGADVRLCEHFPDVDNRDILRCACVQDGEGESEGELKVEN